MQIKSDDVKQILNALTGSKPTDEEAEALSQKHPESRDLLFHLLTDQPTLSQSPALLTFLQNLIPPVRRNCLVEKNGAESLEFAKTSMQRSLRIELFEKQKEYALALGKIRSLEDAIYKLKKSIVNL
jgi:hypothetical protein